MGGTMSGCTRCTRGSGRSIIDRPCASGADAEHRGSADRWVNYSGYRRVSECHCASAGEDRIGGPRDDGRWCVARIDECCRAGDAAQLWFDALGALGTGLFNALVVNFLSVIARREGSDPMLLAAIVAAPFAANMLSILSGFWVPGDTHRVRYVSVLLVLGRALFLFSAVTTAPWALLSMTFGLFLTQALAAPSQVDIWRGTYPQRLRARALGYLRVLQTASGALAAPLGGLLMERIGPGALLGLGAGLGMVGATAVSQVRAGSVRASQSFTPLGSLKVLSDQPEYRGLVAAWVVWGLGVCMAAPLYALVLVDRFEAGYGDIGVLQLVGAASGLVAYLVLGQHLDRRGGFGASPLGMAMVALVPIVYVVAPSLPMLALAFLLQSVGNSAIDLGWQVTLIARVSDEHRLRYQAVHTSLTGLRGVVAPFIGSLAIGLGVGLGTTLLASGLLALVGAAIMLRTLGLGINEVPLLRAVARNARRPGGDLVVGHRVLGARADVSIAPALDVDQVLLARQRGAMTDALAGRRSAQGVVQTAQQVVHDPAGDTLALARVDVPEQHEVRQQDAPVRAKATQ
jgi:predicted MFS family arabinose efflux permease